ncbi:MAG: PASTA domain-containing protein [Gemmatimonadetes bacterium]|nr:PASTA domain-containing protein [Gemmatimonadota bacterium]
MTYRRRRGLGGGRTPRGGTANASGTDRPASGDTQSTEGTSPSRATSRSESTGGWKPWAIAAVVVGGLFLVGYITADLWLTPGESPSEVGGLVTVPELVGLSDQEARSRLAEVGLEHGVRSAMSHPGAPEGAVLAQSPIPGQQVRPGAPVEVTLSRGPEVHSIPDVSGLSARQASIVLDRLGFRVTSREANHSIEAGRAFGTEPGPGTELTVPADVTLMVSKGSPLTTVPDLSGRHIDDALELLSESGLSLGAISYDPLSLDAPGRIVGQYPPGGYGLRRGDPVEVRVAGRPEEVNRSRPDRPVGQDSDQPEEL